jgi:peptide deformylase
MDLQQAISILCPDMTNERVRQSIDIFTGYPLVDWSMLKAANYSFPTIRVPGRTQARSALEVVGNAMLDVCQENGYGALASTQVGLSFPMVVFQKSGYIIQKPQYQSVGKETTIAVEGCGSIFNARAVYLGKYPKTIELTFFDQFGKYYMFSRFQSDDWGLNTADLMESGRLIVHEIRHLKGLTILDGWMANPNEVLPASWTKFQPNYVEVFLNKEWQERITLKCQEEQTGEDWGRSAFREYLRLCVDAYAGSRDIVFLLPYENTSKDKFRIATIEEYLLEI